MMSLDRLTGFYWVAQTGGYARAARAFPYPITEPGVHQQVRRLEEELGVRLFRRVARDRMVLTPEGRELQEVVAPFLARLRTTVDGLRAGSFGGTLRIATAALLVQELLPAWMLRLQRRHPGVSLTLRESRTPDIDALRTAEVDLLIDHLPAIPDDLEVREVARLWGFLVVPARHPAVRRGRVDLRALQGLPFLSFGGDPANQLLQRRAVEALGGTLREGHAADSTASLLGLVAAGLGFSVVPALDPRGPRRSGVRSIRLRLPGAEFSVYAAWVKGFAHPLVHAALAVAPTLRRRVPATPVRGG
jgi:DNA-binding transcriptional LysR family regulator